jgi:hypothetical protein
MGAIIEFTKRQNPDVLRSPEEWSTECRKWISARV